MPTLVRAARRDDGQAFLALVDALAEYERLPGPDADARSRLLAHGFGPDPRFRLLLAEEDATVVGYALFFPTYSSFVARPSLYLEDLFVLPAHRGRGHGAALLRAIAGEAVALGCGRMEWAVLTWNEPALAFYERLGAERLEGWRTYRLSGDALAAVAQR